MKDALLRRLNGSRVEFIGRRDVASGRGDRRMGDCNSLVRNEHSNHLVPVSQWTWDQYLVPSLVRQVFTAHECSQLGMTGDPCASLMRSAAGMLHLPALPVSLHNSTYYSVGHIYTHALGLIWLVLYLKKSIIIISLSIYLCLRYVNALPHQRRRSALLGQIW